MADQYGFVFPLGSLVKGRVAIADVAEIRREKVYADRIASHAVIVEHRLQVCHGGTQRFYGVRATNGADLLWLTEMELVAVEEP